MLKDAKPLCSIFRAAIQYFILRHWDCFTYLQGQHMTVHVDNDDIQDSRTDGQSCKIVSRPVS